ncbi:MAG: hypothetical protein IPM82_27250 [Saprospiraceae bacterium]|nr:hypothetical protein [Saprospiraceae bacterium]
MDEKLRRSFVVRFRGAKQKLSFIQFGTDGQQAEVACISKFKSTEIHDGAGLLQRPD